MSDIDKVISNGYCIGCGSCQVENNVKTLENDYGMYYPDIEDISKLNNKACPFSNTSENEIEISSKLYENNENIHFHKHIGYYLSLYAGHVKDENIRNNATSGGLTKWLLCMLLKNNLIDGVIHVVRKKNSKTLFEYDIGYSEEDILNGSHSAYYTNNFSSIMNKILKNNDDKKYAFIGVPCYCKSMRLLCNENKEISNKISFVFGILCGHMKTKNYAKFMAMEAKLDPNQLTYVNFRKKNNTTSSDYIFNSKDNNNEVNIRRQELQGGNYNIPHMKYKACDFCEDVFGYCADVVLGDAWLPKYNKDPKGDNVVIVRNEEIQKILSNNTELHLDILNENDVIKSQSSSYSHRIEEIGYRLYKEIEQKNWFPEKMSTPVKNLKNVNREEIQEQRIEIREKSHEFFLDALNGNDINIYKSKIKELVSNLNSKYK